MPGPPLQQKCPSPACSQPWVWPCGPVGRKENGEGGGGEGGPKNPSE